MKNDKLIKTLEQAKLVTFGGYVPAILLTVREVNRILKALRNE